MSRKKVSVPPPPAEQVVITSQDSKNLEDWKEFFRKLSTRITLIQTTDKLFEGLLDRIEHKLRRARAIGPESDLHGWPTKEDLCFVLVIDSSFPGSKTQKHEIADVYFFCYGDRAFAPTHFEWDGDAESGEGTTTFSLSNYTPVLLSWEFMQSLVVNKLQELENQVPKKK